MQGACLGGVLASGMLGLAFLAKFDVYWRKIRLVDKLVHSKDQIQRIVVHPSLRNATTRRAGVLERHNLLNIAEMGPSTPCSQLKAGVAKRAGALHVLHEAEKLKKEAVLRWALVRLQA